MTIYEQLKYVLKNEVNNIFSTSELKAILYEKYGANPNSILLSDFCYNRYNSGIKFDKHIFEYINRSSYRYLGENYPYTGLIFHKARGDSNERIYGEWISGVKYIYEDTESEIIMSKKQINKLYQEYNNILRLEMNILGCKPTELRHLIGRIGEFICVLKTEGRLARHTNQHGFDVISDGKRISVKTTAQRQNFISINKNTFKDFDNLFVVQYINDEFKVIYNGPKEKILGIAREYDTKYEVDISAIKKLEI